MLRLGLIIVFVLFRRSQFRLDRAHWTFFILYGLTLSLFNSMWTFSVQFNGAAIATVLAFSSPAMTAVLAHFILKEQINAIKLSSIVMSLLGTALVSGAVDPSAWKVNPSGIIFGLLTGLFFAFYTLMGKTSSNKSIDPWTTMLYGFSSAVFFLFLFNLLMNIFYGAGTFRKFPMAGDFSERMGDPGLPRYWPHSGRLWSLLDEPWLFTCNHSQLDRGP